MAIAEDLLTLAHQLARLDLDGRRRHRFADLYLPLTTLSFNSWYKRRRKGGPVRQPSG